MKTHPLAIVLLAACGDGAGTTSPDAGVDAATEELSGTVLDGTTAIAGAQVCFDACTTSNVDGTWTQSVIDQALEPSSVPGLLIERKLEHVTAPGFLGEVYLAARTSSGLTNYVGGQLFPDDVATTYLATHAQFRYPDATTGFVRVRVSGVSGATATISSDGSGPIYLDSTGTPNPALTAAVADGGILFGNVQPGMATITVMASGERCSVTHDNIGLTSGTWPPSGAGTVDLAVAAGALTDSIVVTCF